MSDYEGWSNRATWLTHLHLSSDRALLETALTIMDEARSSAVIPFDAHYSDEQLGAERILAALRHEEASALEYALRDLAHEVIDSAEPSAAAELVRDALREWLQRADWLELVDALSEVQMEELSAAEDRIRLAAAIHADYLDEA